MSQTYAEKVIAELLDVPPPGGQLPPIDRSGTSGGMDPWQTSVESRLGQLHADITGLRTDLGGRIDGNLKWTLSTFGASVVLILGAMAGGFIYLADKIAALPH